MFRSVLKRKNELHAASSLSNAEIDDFVQRYPAFSPKDVRRVLKRFQHVASSETESAVEPNDLLALPLAVHPEIYRRVVARLTGPDGIVDVRSLLDALAICSCPGMDDAKAHIIFDVFDADGDGTLGPSDVKQLLASVAGPDARPAHLAKMADALIASVAGGKMTFQQMRTLL
jgi:Ca2+-binding EF-hand superfamily protein